VDVSDWTSSDGDELSLDWAGDSPTYSMTRIELADGREFSAVALEPGEPPLDVTISGAIAADSTS
jgi:hypothetical protein